MFVLFSTWQSRFGFHIYGILMQVCNASFTPIILTNIFTARSCKGSSICSCHSSCRCCETFPAIIVNTSSFDGFSACNRHHLQYLLAYITSIFLTYRILWIFSEVIKVRPRSWLSRPQGRKAFRNRQFSAEASWPELRTAVCKWKSPH